MWSNTKAVVEEHLSSENVTYIARYLHSDGRYDHDDEVLLTTTTNKIYSTFI